MKVLQWFAFTKQDIPPLETQIFSSQMNFTFTALRCKGEGRGGGGNIITSVCCKLVSLQIQNNRQAERSFVSKVKSTTYRTYRDHIRCVKNKSTEFRNIKSETVKIVKGISKIYYKKELFNRKTLVAMATSITDDRQFRPKMLLRDKSIRASQSKASVWNCHKNLRGIICTPLPLSHRIYTPWTWD